MAKSEPFVIESGSVESTERLGRLFGSFLEAGDVISLSGALGVGKTALVRGIALGLEIEKGEWIHSPSYTILNEYRGPVSLFHFDLYRLKRPEELEETGFPDYLGHLGESGVVVVEWADRFPMEFPPGTFCVNMKYFEAESPETQARRLFFSTSGLGLDERANQRLREFAKEVRV